jgi:glycosyltransferase involved in cell wall biosynthesis
MLPTSPNISAYIICQNEADNIRRCLESIKWCNQIVVVDSGSTDTTLDICREYNADIYYRSWSGYGDQKNFALSKCKGTWVLNIDADEEVSLELKEEIIEAISTARSPNIAGFYCLRVVRFLNRWWYAGDWHPEYRLRLAKRESIHWTTEPVHEKAVVKGKTKKLSGPLFHYTYISIEQQIARINKYSTLSSDYRVQMFRPNRSSSIFLQRAWLSGSMIIRPLLRFFRFYIIRRSFLYGTAGLIVAINDAFYVFLKYAKLWEAIDKQHNLSHPGRHKHTKENTLNNPEK